jgi:hypothetical protein
MPTARRYARALIGLLLALTPALALAAQGCMNFVAQGPNGVKDVPMPATPYTVWKAANSLRHSAAIR